MKKILAIITTSILVSTAGLAQGGFATDGRLQPSGNFPITKFGEHQTGYWPLSRLSQRDSIPTWQRTYGMEVYVSATDSVYVLKDPTLGNSNWTAYKQSSVDFTTLVKYTDTASMLNPYLLNYKGVKYTDTTYTGYAKVLTQSKANGLYPTLTGGGATGTWPISISGNAASVTNGLYNTDTTYTGYAKVLTQSKAGSLYAQPFNHLSVIGTNSATTNNTNSVFVNSSVIGRGLNTDTLQAQYINNTIYKAFNSYNSGMYVNSTISGGVLFSNNTNNITLYTTGLTAGAYTNVVSTSVNGVGATFNVTVTGTTNNTCVISVNQAGYGYFGNDVVNINKNLLGGTTGTISFNVDVNGSGTGIILNNVQNGNGYFPPSFLSFNINGSNKGFIRFRNDSYSGLEINSPTFLNLFTPNNYGVKLISPAIHYSTITQQLNDGLYTSRNDITLTSQHYSPATNDNSTILIQNTYQTGTIATYTIVGGSGYRDTTGNFSTTTTGVGYFSSNSIPATTSGGVLSSVNFFQYGLYAGIYNFKIGDTIRFNGLPGGTGSYVLVTSITPATSGYTGITYNSSIADNGTKLTYNGFRSVPSVNTGSVYSGYIRGFYHNANITSIGSGRNIAFENKNGDNLFNSGSGKTYVGYDSTAYKTTMFNVKGSVNFNKDSIQIFANTKWKLGIDSITGNIIRDSTSGTITGTGVANQLAYWNGTSSLTGNNNLTWNGTQLSIGALNNTSNYNMNFGTFYGQSYSLNNGFLFDNAYFNGSNWQKITNGYASGFQLYSGQILMGTYNTGSGTFAMPVYTFKNDFNGNNFFGNGINTALGNTTGVNVSLLGNGRSLFGTTVDNGVDRLQVNGSVMSSSQFLAGSTGYFSGLYGGSANNLIQVNVDSASNTKWSIGSNTGFQTVPNNRNLNFNYFNGTSWLNYLNISTLGNASLSGSVTATAFYNSSDKRLKNILSRKGDMVTFRWKDGKDKLIHYGYIAQEVRKTMPNQVLKDDKGFFSVNYTEVHTKKINDLENEVAELKQQINELKNIIKALQQ